MFNILRLTDAINREDMVVCSVREVGRSVVRLPGLSIVVTALLLKLDKKLKCGSHYLSSPIVGTTIIMLAGDWGPCAVPTSRSCRCSIFELVASRKRGNYFFSAFRLVINKPNHRSCRLFSALLSLSQFGRERLSLVAISFYTLSPLFWSCCLSEFTPARPPWIQ